MFAPLGATWYYRPWLPGPPETALYTFTAAGDTLLDGWNARVLRCSVWDAGELHPVDSLNKYVVVRADKVFYRVAGEFVLLFDFGAQPGDTIASKVEHFPIFDGCAMPLPGSVWDFQYRVDSVSTISIGGTILRAQYARGIDMGSDNDWLFEGFNSFPIIERAGGTVGGQWWGSGGACVLAGFPGYLRCYTDSEVYYQPPLPWWGTGGPCDFVSVNESVVADLKITPNPAVCFAQLPFAPDRAQVFNMFGQSCSASLLSEMLDVSALTPGIYMVWVEKDGVWYSGKLAVGR